MNWRLTFQLSLFGLAMGIGTVIIIPSNVEPLFWLVIFIISAYLIATRSGGWYFSHGVLVGIANSVWITACHVLLFSRYIASAPRASPRGNPSAAFLLGACESYVAREWL